MITLRQFVLGALALISYALMFFLIIRFFDAMNLLNGVFMVGSWLLTIGLCWAADRAGKKKDCCG